MMALTKAALSLFSCGDSVREQREKTQDERTSSEERLVTQIQSLAIEERPPSSLLTPCPVGQTSSDLPLLTKTSQLAYALFNSPNMLQTLQRIASGLLPDELQEFITRKKIVLLERMKHPREPFQEPSIHSILSAPSQERKVSHFLVLNYGDDDRTGVYADCGVIGRGTEKKIQKIVSVTPPLGTAPKSYALASFSQRYIEYNRKTVGEEPSFIDEVLLVHFLHKHHVPYIINMSLLPYLSHRRALIPEFSCTQDPPQQLVMEYCNKGTLETFAPTLRTLIDKMTLAAQVALALMHMHALDVFHNDLKASNIGICDDGRHVTVRLLDFGASRLSPRAKPEDIDVCASFSPPEMMRNNRQKRLTPVTPAIDAWAFGELLMFLFADRSLLLAWQLTHDSTTYEQQIQRFFTHAREQNQDAMHPIERFSLRLFSENPLDRPSARETFEFLRNWIREERSKHSRAPSLPTPPVSVLSETSRPLDSSSPSDSGFRGARASVDVGAIVPERREAPSASA